MGPLTPYLAIAWLVSVLAVGGVAAWKATKIANEHCQVVIGKMVVESQQRKDQEARKARAEAVRLETDYAKSTQELQDAQRQVATLRARASTRVLCLDDDGLRAARAAIAGPGAAAPGPGAAVPPSPRPH